ncbi:MAG: hypothetical protein HOL28_09400 [Crocinitomicaceae bacterium]|jgi:hypothetical protein|nr:hypothetical protein [Crocinitomicaceae bacterium]MBT5403646.1 hypothetical protein [Crocinitomicaceae bacterium]MBT6513251.1 hypothetical protein [Crocinitomicaceae bacterium]
MRNIILPNQITLKYNTVIYMKLDSKITIITGLTFTLFGLLGLLAEPYRFILPEFSIPAIIPLFCLFYFIANWQSVEGIFFIFYPLIFVHAFIELFWGQNFNWLVFLSYIAPIIMFISVFRNISIWKKLIWIPLLIATSLLCTISFYLVFPERMSIFLLVIFTFSTITLSLNNKYFTLPQPIKQQFLILSLSCVLIVLSIISHWID